MPYMYSEMQNKLSKTRESPLESMGQIISSRCPCVFCGLMYKTARKRERQEQTLRFIHDVSSFATLVIYGAT